MKKALSLLSIFGVAMIAAFVPESAHAAEGGGELTKLGLALGAGLGIGIAAGVAGLGQGRATAARYLCSSHSILATRKNITIAGGSFSRLPPI